MKANGATAGGKFVNFNVLLTEEDSWYIAKCVDNSVASQGRTIDEAPANLREALELYDSPCTMR